MGRHSKVILCLWVFMWVVVFLLGVVTSAAKSVSVCEIPGCNCTAIVSSWKTLNCTLGTGQELNLQWQHHLPSQINEMYISGGEKVILGARSVAHLPGLAIIQVENTRVLSIESHSLFSLTCPSLLLRIRNCDRITIKTGAIENVESSINVEIHKCRHVALEKSAFSKLESGDFRHIKRLELGAGTFQFANQANADDPLSIISFSNVTIPKIPHQAFFASLSRVLIENSLVNEIQKEAFYATQISAITMKNSKIDYIRSEAFSQKMQILDFHVSKCTIAKIESKAITGGITNLTVQNSSVTEIESGAINNTVVKFELIGNEIVDFQPAAVNLQGWSTIVFEQNIIKNLHTSFLIAPPNPNVLSFKFEGNDVFHLDQGALSFVPELDDKIFHFKNNFFNQTCHCFIHEWIIDLLATNVTNKVKTITNNTFCNVNDLLSTCFQLPVGIINIKNFTELVCNANNTIVCEPYRGETKIVNTTSKIFSEPSPPKITHWLTLIISCTSVLLLAFLATTVIMLIRGSRWLKRKGYFRKIQYNQNEHSNDEENTIETVDESDKLEANEDLSMELLEYLKTRLADPATAQEAQEQIEQLYAKYVHESGNNNEQDEEAHLYEELGNLQNNLPLQQQEAFPEPEDEGPRSILRIMEEKFLQLNEDGAAAAAGPVQRPPLMNEYSEPSDAAVHLYSELKKEADNNDTIKSKSSGNSMAFRPLPDKPGSSRMN